MLFSITSKRFHRNASGILLVLFLSLVASGCGTDQRVKAAIATSDAFDAAVRDGDHQAVDTLLARDSRPYFALDSVASAWYRSTRFTVVKVEAQREYVRIQLLQETDSIQSAKFRYVIREDGKDRIQFPFIIFAKNWQKLATRHFVYHEGHPAPGTLLAAGNGDSLRPVCDSLEAFHDKLDSLFGLDSNFVIDYYHVANEEEGGLLAGEKPMNAVSHGRDLITTRSTDFQDIALILLRRKINSGLFRYGIEGWAAFQQPPRVPAHPYEKEMSIARHVAFLGGRPVSTLDDADTTELSPEAKANAFAVGGALFEMIIEQYGSAKFHELYQASERRIPFSENVKSVLHTDLAALDKQLSEKYNYDEWKARYDSAGGTM